jgi:hypothetical protein
MLVVKNSLLAKANVSQPIFGIDFLSKKYLAIDCNKGCMIFPASCSRFSFPVHSATSLAPSFFIPFS